MKRRAQTVLLALSTLAVGVAVAVLVVEEEAIVVRWHHWKYESGDAESREFAAQHLIELRRADLVPRHVTDEIAASLVDDFDEEAVFAVANRFVAAGGRRAIDDFFFELLREAEAEAEADAERLDFASLWFQEHGGPDAARRLLEEFRRVVERPFDADAFAKDESRVVAMYNSASRIVERHPDELLPTLIELLDTPATNPGAEYQTRVCVTHVIASLGSRAESALAKLRTLAQDEDAQFRKAVQDAVRRIEREIERSTSRPKKLPSGN